MAVKDCETCGGPRVQEGRRAYKTQCMTCYNRDRYRRNPARQRRNQLKSSYKMTADFYLEMLESQGGACAICGVPEPYPFGLRPDHDHACCPERPTCGECTRGLLCDTCNRGIGFLKDNPVLLRRAAEYIEEAR